MIPDVEATTREAVNLRRSVVVAACLGGAALAVLAPFGRGWLALFCCLGLALGLLNLVLVRRSAARFAVSEDPNKKRRFAVSVLGRLALITALALGFALMLQPDGLGVFAGLAVFQFLTIATASIPLLRELRQSGAQV